MEGRVKASAIAVHTILEFLCELSVNSYLLAGS